MRRLPSILLTSMIRVVITQEVHKACSSEPYASCRYIPPIKPNDDDARKTPLDDVADVHRHSTPLRLPHPSCPALAHRVAALHVVIVKRNSRNEKNVDLLRRLSAIGDVHTVVDATIMKTKLQDNPRESLINKIEHVALHTMHHNMKQIQRPNVQYQIGIGFLHVNK